MPSPSPASLKPSLPSNPNRPPCKTLPERPQSTRNPASTIGAYFDRVASMRTCWGRFSLFCLLFVLSQGVLALPAVSQDSKPDEDTKKSIPRAGVNGVGTPVCVYCPSPEYSEKARADKLQGAVLLDITVTPEGKATRILLIKGQGEGLDEKAIEAVKSWKLRPAKDATGTPVAVRIQVQVTFHLRK